LRASFFAAIITTAATPDYHPDCRALLLKIVALHQVAGGRQLPLPHVHAATPALMSAVAQYFNGPSSARRRTRNKVFASDPSADLSGVGFGDDATKIVGFEGLEPSRRARVQS
jgi:hypothetical protein